jgi:hypothetical protein
VDVPLFMQLLQPLLDLITLTSPVSDSGSAGNFVSSPTPFTA